MSEKEELSESLQELNGIGPETADDIIEIIENHYFPKGVIDDIEAAYGYHWETENHHHARKHVRDAYEALK